MVVEIVKIFVKVAKVTSKLARDARWKILVTPLDCCITGMKSKGLLIALSSFPSLLVTCNLLLFIIATGIYFVNWNRSMYLFFMKQMSLNQSLCMNWSTNKLFHVDASQCVIRVKAAEGHATFRAISLLLKHETTNARRRSGGLA